jgi:hypothetical protein
MQSGAASLPHCNRLNPLKSQAFQTRTTSGCFFAAQRNTLYGPVLGIDGLLRLKKETFFETAVTKSLDARS